MFLKLIKVKFVTTAKDKDSLRIKKVIIKAYHKNNRTLKDIKSIVKRPNLKAEKVCHQTLHISVVHEIKKHLQFD